MTELFQGFFACLLASMFFACIVYAAARNSGRHSRDEETDMRRHFAANKNEVR